MDRQHEKLRTRDTMMLDVCSSCRKYTLAWSHDPEREDIELISKLFSFSISYSASRVFVGVFSIMCMYLHC